MSDPDDWTNVEHTFKVIAPNIEAMSDLSDLLMDLMVENPNRIDPFVACDQQKGELTVMWHERKHPGRYLVVDTETGAWGHLEDDDGDNLSPFIASGVGWVTIGGRVVWDWDYYQKQQEDS